MIFITGDNHGSFSHIARFCRKQPSLSKQDTIVLLGDTGLNYYGDERDRANKEKAQALPVTLLCLHGNHDRRPAHLPEYREHSWRGGTVYREAEYPDLLFIKDGELFDLEGRSTLAVGGGYSIDKQYRLSRGYHWFADEQPSPEIKRRTEEALERVAWSLDTMLTHTCPIRYEPTEAFFSGIDQSTVDKTTERWLDGIERRLDYRLWYCGHFHINKSVDKLRFLYKEIIPF